MKKLMTVLAALLVVLMLAGCSMQPPAWAKANRSADAENLKIGLSISTLNNPFFVSLKDGVEAQAQKLGIEVIVVDAQNDSAKQSNDVDDLLQQGINALLVNPTDSAAISSAVQAANVLDIPVIALDRSADQGDVKALVASDNAKGGQMAAEYLAEQLGEGAKVIELQGVPGASATRERGRGFHEIADKRLDVIASQAADFDRTKGLTVMENLLQGNPGVQAVFAHNDEMALGAIEAIESSGKDIPVVGFDGNDDALTSIQNGKLTATVAQQPDLIGQLAVDAARDVLQGKEVEASIPAPLKLVTKEDSQP
ncbi:ribose ABC transporter substrate-binding protein RbsB [Saccharibacillus kuerlensis]|uniref:Ribose import binding protein RbsB n=1 Tax=Saccharibacillus kuerlensis TaxID=459527 RepID=A0ABQ2LBK2_9BACL|nr:ribose ABC transporter substrate-binding protein RbsB [Saccharibacillus kuerlensis]GGO09420.1 ribose import binding protein RbsB [Saccharibacillus kuerlensis]